MMLVCEYLGMGVSGLHISAFLPLVSKEKV